MSKGRRKIKFDEADNFEIDEKSNELYWMGKKVVTKNEVSLRRAELILAFLGAVGAFAQGVYAVLSYYFKA